jgi:hypothetical protein
MKKWNWSLSLLFTVAFCHFLGCGSAKPEPTPAELKKIEAEIVKGESAL